MQPFHKSNFEDSHHKVDLLYSKPKSWYRSLLQKIFLKILSKLFPKKFLSYKEKTIKIVNKIRFFSYYKIPSIYLRFKYPTYFFKLPSSHLYAIHTFFKYTEILKKEKIDFFLLASNLLGSVRQESFADIRDIDLGIKEDQLPKLIKALPLFEKKGVLRIVSASIKNEIKLDPSEPNSVLKGNTLERFQMNMPFILVDITIFRKKILDGKKMWIGETDKFTASKFRGIALPEEDLENLKFIDVYGKKFPSPANPETYLKQKYGDSWETPKHTSISTTVNEFFWNKNKIK